MESALITSPPTAWARRRASADLPLAVGPAISQMRGASPSLSPPGPMLLALTLVTPNFDILQEALPMALEAVAMAGPRVERTEILGDGAADILVQGSDPTMLRTYAQSHLGHLKVDVCAQIAE